MKSRQKFPSSLSSYHFAVDLQGAIAHWYLVLNPGSFFSPKFNNHLRNRVFPHVKYIPILENVQILLRG
jgi:hypothetical protein